MARGWDVLLSGERSARGRMDLGGGRQVKAAIRIHQGHGVGFSCEVLGEDPLGAEDVFEAALEQRRCAGELEGAVRAVA